MAEEKIQRNVYVLGIVSFLTDVSTEMILPILPLFMVNVLKADVSLVGLVEGVAESTASILKIFSGWLSDKIKKRKLIVICGYSFSTIAKPLFALSTSWFHVLFIRFLDRVGKGIRTTPRDALVADVSVKKTRGKAFGIHRAMDTLGAVIGPILAFLLLSYYGSSLPVEDICRNIFWISFIPGFFAVAALVLFVKETAPKVNKYRFDMKLLHPDLKPFLIATLIFALANFSYAFFILRAQSLGIAAAFIPLIYLFYNIVYAGFSIPAGSLSDRIGRRPIIIASYVLFSLICLSFAFAPQDTDWFVWLLFALYGVFAASFESVQKAFVSDISTPENRATIIGAYNGAVGIGALPASILSGALWQFYGPSVAFLYGSAVAIIAAAVVFLFVGERKRQVA